MKITGSTNKNIYFILTGVLMLIWSVNWSMTRLALEYIPPLWLGMIRFALGTIILFICLLATKNLKLPGRKDMPVLISVALFQMAFFVALTNAGVLFVGAGRSAILAYTTPLWITPLAFFIFKERISPLKFLGLILGLLGVGLLFNPASFNWHDRHVLIGNGFLLLAALGWALCILHVRFTRWYLNPLQLLPWQMLVATIILFFLAKIFEPHTLITWSPHLIMYVLYISLIGTVLGYWIAIEITKNLPTVTTSLSFLGVPILSIFVAHLILGEAITPTIIASLLLIITGIICVIRATTRPLKIIGE